MSYCGTCGTFYSPECVRRGEGGCMPAVNPYELMIVKQQATITLANVNTMILTSQSRDCIMALSEIAIDLEKIVNQTE